MGFWDRILGRRKRDVEERGKKLPASDELKEVKSAAQQKPVFARKETFSQQTQLLSFPVKSDADMLRYAFHPCEEKEWSVLDDGVQYDGKIIPYNSIKSIEMSRGLSRKDKDNEMSGFMRLYLKNEKQILLYFSYDQRSDARAAFKFIKTMYKKQNHKMFVESNHPFFASFSDHPSECAERMWAGMKYFPNTYNIEKNRFEAWSRSFRYIETPQYIASNYSNHSYKYECQFHYGRPEHFENGEFEEVEYWTLYITDTFQNKNGCNQYKKSPKEGTAIPPCAVLLERDGHVYVENPWGLQGIFEYYYSHYKRDYNSEQYHELGYKRRDR